MARLSPPVQESVGDHGARCRMPGHLRTGDLFAIEIALPGKGRVNTRGYRRLHSDSAQGRLRFAGRGASADFGRALSVIQQIQAGVRLDEPRNAPPAEPDNAPRP